MVLAPVPPFAEWLADLDAMAASSPGFFGNRPILLDLAAVPDASRDVLAVLVADLGVRGIRIMAVENANDAQIGPELPPLVTGGRDGRRIDPAVPSQPEPSPSSAGLVSPEQRDEAPGDISTASVPVEPEPASDQPTQTPAPEAPPTEAGLGDERTTPSLVVDTSVRSGQSVVFPEGDVTVIGSVASGAEVIAGGSIHIYGALRGRAIAGTTGQVTARIFCSRLEAELLAIDGLYFTADQMQAHLRGRPVQTWLSGDAMLMAALDDLAPTTKR